MTPPNFKKGIGRLATDRYDFENHLNGTNPPGFSNFRHNADQIDIVNSNLVFGNPSNVEQALESLNIFASQSLANGQGFVTVGDGYDTYHAANGTINFDPTVPSIDTLLNPIFQTIANAQAHLAGNALPFPSAPFIVPSEFARIQYGGIIVIKSGTYIVKNMIQVPPGITILGEGYGTKLVNASALNTSVAAGSPPTPLVPSTISNASNTNPIQITTTTPHGLTTGQYVSTLNINGNTNANTILAKITVVDALNFTLNGIAGSGAFTMSPSAVVLTQNPIFFILPDINRNDNDAAVDPTANNMFMFARETKIINLVLGDNFIEPTVLGDPYYKLPQNHTNSTGDASLTLIYQQSGSNLLLDNVYALGKVTFSSGTTVSSVTTGLVQTFVYPIIPNTGANPAGGSILKVSNCFLDGFAVPIIFAGLNNNKDYVNIVNNKIRAYGYQTGNSTAVNNNTFINTSDANLTITGNYFYGNDTNILSIANIGQISSGGPPALQAKSKVISSGNNVLIGKISSSNNVTNNTFQFYTFGSIVSNIFNYISLSGRPTVVSSSSPYSNTSPYNIESNTSNLPSNILLVDTTSIAWTLNLPGVAGSSHPVGPGQTITIKDFKGNAATNNITVVAPSGVSIEGIVGSKIFSTNFGSWTLVSFNDGTITGWFLV